MKQYLVVTVHGPYQYKLCDDLHNAIITVKLFGLECYIYELCERFVAHEVDGKIFIE